MVVVAIAVTEQTCEIVCDEDAATMTRVGSAHASCETARPWMTFVPCPVTEAWLIERTGR